jgi:hypothetical protein
LDFELEQQRLPLSFANTMSDTTNSNSVSNTQNSHSDLEINDFFADTIVPTEFLTQLNTDLTVPIFSTLSSFHREEIHTLMPIDISEDTDEGSCDER